MTEIYKYPWNTLSSGTYEYKRPTWEGSRTVNVLFKDNKFYIQFTDTMIPVRLTDAPEDAIFIKE